MTHTNDTQQTYQTATAPDLSLPQITNSTPACWPVMAACTEAQHPTSPPPLHLPRNCHGKSIPTHPLVYSPDQQSTWISLLYSKPATQHLHDAANCVGHTQCTAQSAPASAAPAPPCLLCLAVSTASALPGWLRCSQPSLLASCAAAGAAGRPLLLQHLWPVPAAERRCIQGRKMRAALKECVRTNPAGVHEHVSKPCMAQQHTVLPAVAAAQQKQV